MSDLQDINESVLTLSSKAVNRVHLLLEDEADPMFFRVYITGGGCSGFQYGFSFDKSTKPDDCVVQLETDVGTTVRVVIDPLSQMYLFGAEIDYLEGLQGSYFKVNNPNAKTTCGCGSSFSI